MMHEHGKSDKPIVPEKPTNKELGAPSSAEGVEGRGLAEGAKQGPGTAPGSPLQSELDRIRQAAVG